MGTADLTQSDSISEEGRVATWLRQQAHCERCEGKARRFGLRLGRDRGFSGPAQPAASPIEAPALARLVRFAGFAVAEFSALSQLPIMPPIPLD